MNLRYILLTVLLCGVLSAARAVTPMRLPDKHQNIFDTEVQKAAAGTFATASMEEARKNSPFVGMEHSFAMEVPENFMALKMVDYAKRFLGTRYRLGSTGPKAFDCSGFTSYVYKNFGITLDRTSRQQYLQGDRVSVGNLRPGDLLFFSSRSAGRGNVGHVAMVVSVDPQSQTCRFIHASVKKGVTYQTFPDNGYYSRNFIGARRILGSDMDMTTAVAQN